MELPKNYLDKFSVEERKKIKNRRAQLLEEVCTFLKVDYKDKREFGKLLRLTKGKTPNQIRHLMAYVQSSAVDARNPRGLFIYLLKNERN